MTISVRYKDSLNHNEIENFRPSHFDVGRNALLHPMLERAKVME